MKLRKIYILLILFFSTVFCSFSYDVKIGEFNYALDYDNGTAIVTGRNQYSTENEIEIPMTVDTGVKTYTIVGIQGNAFENSNIKSVILPETITIIGENAFKGCENLISINIPSKIERIEDGTFQGCRLLPSIILPQNLYYIGNDAFNGCHSLSDFDFPERVYTIGANAFYNCISLRNLVFPKNLVELYTGAFQYAGVESLDFSQCNRLNIIYNYCFASCYNLRTVVFPYNLRKLGHCAFAECKLLTTVILPPLIEEVENNSAFDGCKGLIKCAYPDILKSNPFKTGISVCYPFRTAKIEKNNCIYSSNKSVLYYVPIDIETYEFPEEVMVIENNAFAKCSNIITLKFPDSLYEIGKMAFRDCIGLSSINFPASLNEIKDGAFYNCKGITEIMIPENVKALGTGIFDLGNLRKVYYNAARCNFESNVKSSIFPRLEEIVIGDKVQYIPDYCFPEGKFKDINIPAHINQIGNYAFKAAEQLENLNIIDSDQPLIIGSYSITKGSATNQVIDKIYLGRNCINGQFSQIDVKQIEIGSKVNDGKSLAVEKYSSLTKIISQSNTPPLMNFFTEQQYRNLEVIIPANSLELYCENEVWRPFWIIDVTAITLSRNKAEIKEGDSILLDASVSPADATDKTLSWVSSDESVATVNNGLVTGIKPGKARITVTSKNGKSAYCDITVTQVIIEVESVVLNTNEITIKQGKYFTLEATIFPENATDKNIRWLSDDENIATIKDGVIFGKNLGTVLVGALASNGVRDICSVTVVENIIEVERIDLFNTSIEITEGDQFKLIYNIYPADATDNTITWESSDPYIAEVFFYNNSSSSDYYVKGLKPGHTTITAKAPNGVSATCEVEVKEKYIWVESISIIPSSLDLEVGDEFDLLLKVTPENATDPSVTWSSNDPTIVEVDEYGHIYALNVGTAWVYARLNESPYKYKYCVINVTEKKTPIQQIEFAYKDITLAVGEGIELKYTVYPEDIEDYTITWTSSNPNVAIVSESGFIKAVSEGTAIISASCGVASAECVITVLDDAGVESIWEKQETEISVFTPEGFLIKKDFRIEDLKTLSKGIYIIISGKERYKISI